MSASLVASAAKNVLVPMRRKVVMVRDDPSAATTLNKNAYYREYDANKADVGLIKLHYKSAATIQKCARRKLVAITTPSHQLTTLLTDALLSFIHIYCDARPRRPRSCGGNDRKILIYGTILRQ